MPVEAKLLGLGNKFKLQEFQLALQTVRMVIIDKISMLSRDTFDHRRLQEITARPNEFFRGLHMLFVGDLFQLPPSGRYLFMGNDFDNPWLSHIDSFELTEIMRQRDDAVLAEALNRAREGDQTKQDLQLFRTLVTEKVLVLPYSLHFMSTRTNSQKRYWHPILES